MLRVPMLSLGVPLKSLSAAYSTMVEHSTRNHKIEGSNRAAYIGRKRQRKCHYIVSNPPVKQLCSFN
jgi:hypothetical protein